LLASNFKDQWVSNQQTTGTPARWNPPSLPSAISKDDGELRKEEAFERKITPSLTPLFAALGIMEPAYSLLPVSLVTDRKSLRKLFDFVSGTKGFQSWWRIEVEVVKNTMIYTRWEKDSYRFVTGSFSSGYGHEFETAFIKFNLDEEDSMSQHLIIEYEIGGMKQVVRFEADGYFEEYASDVIDQSKDEGTSPSSEHPVTFAKFSPASKLLSSDELTVIQKGFVISPDLIIEVKCVSMNTRSKNNIEKKIAQCWFSQTKHVFVGCQEEGSVLEANKFDIESALEKWEETHQANLKKLMFLITKIKMSVITIEGKKCCLVFGGKQKPALVKLIKSNHGGLSLSDDLKERLWEDQLLERSDT
jgi:hypothetical protein